MSVTEVLPQTWCNAKISEITAVNPTLDKSGIPEGLDISFVPMPAVQAESGIIDVSGIRKFSEVKKGYTPFREGDVLFAKITPCMENGKMAVVPEVRNGIGFGSTEFHVLRAQSGVSAKYVYYYVSSQPFRRVAEHNMSGAVGQRRVTTPYLSACEVPLPPTNEQHRIVAKIEELFSELDKGIENLKTAQAQLKVYRQALLKHAFEGKLTAQWRAERNATSNKPVIPAKAGIHADEKLDSRLRGNDAIGGGNDVPLETAAALQARIQQERAQRYQQQLADWEKSKSPSVPPLRQAQDRLLQRGKTTSAAASVPHFEKGGLGGISVGTAQLSKPKAPKPLPPLTAEELAELPELPEGWGWARLLDACEAVVDCHNKTAPYQAAGIPLIRTPSIRDMKLNFDDAIRYISQETYEYWSRRCPPLPSDILFTREAPMGEAALIPEGKMVCMGQRIMLLRPGKFLSGKYLLSATQNPIFKRVADRMAVGTGVKHLRVGDVERLFFPLCSVIEQNEIASQLDARLSEVDQLDQTITTSLQQAEALRQSILKKAFSGQLVPQNPHDEPASVLLDRIRAEQESVVTPKRTRKSA
jgi:type I restriction enzyme S subunit